MTSLIPTTRTRPAYKTIPFLMCDFYKLSHRAQYPEGTETVYTTWIPRGTRIPAIQDGVVAFGFQGFTYEFLLDYMEDNFFKRPIEEIKAEYKEFLLCTMMIEDADTSHIEAIHELGYLPLEIKAVPEGTIVPFGTPMMVAENTNPEGYPYFYWLTNFLETALSAELWHPSTAATIARRYRQIGEKWAMETNGNTDHLGFQFHDFSMRGMMGIDGASKSAAAHMLSFQGTDTIPGIMYLRDNYFADYTKELVGASIPATEHSVMSAYGQDELSTFERLITVVYPEGLVSIVSDTYDFWGNIEHTIPALKDVILGRDGKVVIRPDSGDPVEVLVGKNTHVVRVEKELDYSSFETDFTQFQIDNEEYFDSILQKRAIYTELADGLHKYKVILLDNDNVIEIVKIVDESVGISRVTTNLLEDYTLSLEDKGLVESLWDIFGGEINELGYKVLDPHIGAIYGDSITPERAEAILSGLAAKGFAASNVVFGVGSFSYQYTTRDTFNMAMKATHTVIDNVEKMIFKQPKTDAKKNSLRGRVVVWKDKDGVVHKQDNLTTTTEKQFEDKLLAEGNELLLQTIFKDGKAYNAQTLADIRSRLW